jgi:hypothetical protein
VVAGVIHYKFISHFSRLTQINELPIVKPGLVLVIHCVFLVHDVSAAVKKGQLGYGAIAADVSCVEYLQSFEVNKFILGPAFLWRNPLLLFFSWCWVGLILSLIFSRPL